ncbi:nucleotide exchange factor GrpE [Patescibacteria group bacterium]|nr:nucleotide exchange factor GrpE [Patescibacteria group bacterium]
MTKKTQKPSSRGYSAEFSRSPQTEGEANSKAQELENQLKRSLADYANLSRRVEEEKNQIAILAKSTLTTKFISVLDTLEAAAKVAAKKGSTATKQGSEIAINQFKKILKEEGVEEIQTGAGFDPSVHEAIEVVPGKRDNKIVEILEKGYKLGDKMLRPARVKVEKNSRSQ